jgi:hypothetical protein
MSCPSGFLQGLGSSCRLDCPADFKYEQRPDGDSCVYSKDNNIRVRLNGFAIPRGRAGPEFDRERQRFDAELTKLRERIRKIEIDSKALQDAKSQSAQWQARSGQIESEAAAYRSVSDAGMAIRDTTASIRVLRPPTAPSSDLEKERRAISLDLKQSLLFVQVVLFIVVLALLAYLVLPIAWAHSIVFLLLCVGVAIGFFLRK